MKKLALFTLCLFLLSCVKKNDSKEPQASGSLVLGFQSSASPIVHLPIRVKAIALIDESNETHLFFRNKLLQLSLLSPQFLSLLPLPVGNYKKMQLHISLKESQLILYDTTAKDWGEAQMVSMNNYAIPQEKFNFFIELPLIKAIKIKKNKVELYNIHLDMAQTLLSAFSEEHYLLFQPAVSLSQAERVLVEGKISPTSETNQLAVHVDEQVLNASFNTMQVNHQSRSPDTLPVYDLAFAQVLIEKRPDGGLHVIDDSLHIITQDQYLGWLKGGEMDLALIGYRRQSGGELTFEASFPVSTRPETLSVFKASQAIDASYLRAGQSVILYQDKEGKRLHLQKVTIDGEITISDDTPVLEPYTIEGKHAEQFSAQPIAISDPENSAYAGGEKVRLRSYFTLDKLTDFNAESEDTKVQVDVNIDENIINTIDEKTITVSIHFNHEDQTLLYHEAITENENRLFFVEGLNNANIHATLKDTAIEVSAQITTIYTNADTTYSLTYQEENNEIREEITSFKAWTAKITPLLASRQQKLLLLTATGTINNQMLTADSLHISLHSPLLDTENDFAPNKDMITEITQLHADDTEEIQSKTINIEALGQGLLIGAGVLSAVALYELGKKTLRSVSTESRNTALKSTFNQFRDASNSDDLKIISLNLQMRPLIDHSALRAKPIADALKDSNADVIAIQELWDAAGKKTLIDELKSIYPYSIDGPDKSKTSYLGGGLMFFSKTPFLNHDALAYDNGFSADGVTNKGALYINIKKNNQDYHLFNSHLQADIEGQDDKSFSVQNEQLAKLSAWSQEIVGNAEAERIYIGDLNIPRGTDREAILHRTLNTTSPNVVGVLQSTQGFENTFYKPAKGESEQWLDYIISNKNTFDLQAIDIVTNQKLRSWIPGRGIEWKGNPANLFKPSPSPKLLDLSDHRAVITRIKR